MSKNRDIEDGMGFGGLVATREERNQMLADERARKLIRTLESEVARLRGLVERMKPYLLGQDRDERWNQLLSDLEKG